MDNGKGKISQYQSILLYIVFFFSPCIRYLPNFTVKEAGQAAWISIFWAAAFGVIFLVVWNSIIKNYRFISYVDILKDIFGKFIGSIITILLFLWLTILAAYYMRIFAERLLSSADTQMNMILLISIFFITALYVLSKSNIVTIARMNEFFFIITISIFSFAILLLVNQLEVRNFYPITYKDIVPSFKASFGIIGIWGYISILFIYYDKVVIPKNFKKLNLQLLLFLIIVSLLIIITPLGLFGEDVLTKMPTPFLSSVMEISSLDTIERLDSAVITLWVINDFILVITFIYCALHIVKVHFKIETARPFLTIYTISSFFLSLIIIKSSFEIVSLSHYILTPLNVVVGAFIPVLAFIVGKIRKKL